MVFISRSWFDMQELVRQTISFNSRQSTDKQIGVTGVSSVSFSGSFPQILRSLQLPSLPIQPSFWPNGIWCVSYRSLSRSWHTDLDYCSYHLPELADGGCDQSTGVLTPPIHLIPPLVYPEARGCPILKYIFMRLMSVRYSCYFTLRLPTIFDELDIDFFWILLRLLKTTNYRYNGKEDSRFLVWTNIKENLIRFHWK
jgi:hypothetical protein